VTYKPANVRGLAKTYLDFTWYNQRHKRLVPVDGFSKWTCMDAKKMDCVLELSVHAVISVDFQDSHQMIFQVPAPSCWYSAHLCHCSPPLRIMMFYCEQCTG